MTLGLAPLLSTAVGQTRVDVHLLDRNIRVYESTALARQVFASDTAAVKLNLNKAPVTPVRRNLQQQLDNSAPLTPTAHVSRATARARCPPHRAESLNMTIFCKPGFGQRVCGISVLGQIQNPCFRHLDQLVPTCDQSRGLWNLRKRYLRMIHSERKLFRGCGDKIETHRNTRISISCTAIFSKKTKKSFRYIFALF